MVLMLGLGLPLGALGCPQPCACYLPTEVHCTFRSLAAVPARIPKHVERINFGFVWQLGASTFMLLVWKPVMHMWQTRISVCTSEVELQRWVRTCQCCISNATAAGMEKLVFLFKQKSLLFSNKCLYCGVSSFLENNTFSLLKCIKKIFN